MQTVKCLFCAERSNKPNCSSRLLFSVTFVFSCILLIFYAKLTFNEVIDCCLLFLINNMLVKKFDILIM